jgi:hypothetical protein
VRFSPCSTASYTLRRCEEPIESLGIVYT